MQFESSTDCLESNLAGISAQTFSIYKMFHDDNITKDRIWHFMSIMHRNVTKNVK